MAATRHGLQPLALPRLAYLRLNLQTGWALAVDVLHVLRLGAVDVAREVEVAPDRLAVNEKIAAAVPSDVTERHWRESLASESCHARWRYARRGPRIVSSRPFWAACTPRGSFQGTT
jgi:hypothetical protein